MTTPAVETTALTKDLILLVTAALLVPLGLWSFRAADRYVRVHSTIAQH